MKRVLTICLAMALLLSTAACGNQVPESQTTQLQTTTQPPETQPKLVTVVLNARGGTCELSELTVTWQQPYGQLPEPQRENYVFQGWFTEPEAGTQILPETLVATADMHMLYARWQEQTDYSLTLDPNGGRLSAYHDQQNVTLGKPYGTLPEPLREGYLFLGWFTDPEAGEQILDTSVFLDREALTVYAHWEYDALAYWTHILHSRVQTIPYCRRVVVYLEKTSNYKTYPDSSFLADAGAINPAERLQDEVVTDEWIRGADPYLIVKLTSDIYLGAVNKVAMQRRLAEMEIYIFPVSAVSGNEKLQLYYRLQLAKILYPEYFADVDLKAVAAELELNPRIYY